MKRIFTSLLLVLGLAMSAQAQLLPSNQCESQTPCNARPICGATVVNPYSYVTTALPTPVGVCGAFLYGAAGNWVYYRFTCFTSGTFNFRLASHDSATVNSDLDWAVWDITTAGCGGINTSLIPVACNAAGNGPTGIQTGGLPAANFAPNLAITAGSTYIIGVSNPSGVNTQGHTLSFAGTTANINDNKKPYMQAIVPFNPCTSVSVIKVKMSEPVRCNQLGVGADFTFSGTTPAFVVTPGVICPGCVNAAPNLAPNFGNASDTATITFASALTPGTYTITAIANAFRDLCSNPDSTEATLVFTVPATFKDTIRSGFDCVNLKYLDTVCGVNGTGPYQYKASGGGLPASASVYGPAIPGCANYSVSGGSQVIYTVRDALGCEKSDTLNRSSVLALGAPNLSASASPPCHDQFSLDSISVISVSGGVGPYTFALAPVFPGIIYLPSVANPTKWKNIVFPGAGSIFTVTVTDAYGCTKTGLRNLVNPPVVSLNAASITPTNPTCFGDSSGKLCFAGASGGTPCGPPNLYSYSILPSYGNTTLTTGGPICFNNLPSGNYTVTASDCNGCTVAAPKVLNQPPLMVINTTAAVLFSHPTCPLPNLGWYQPSATGGSGTKKYYLLPLVSAPNTYTDSVRTLPTPTPTNKFDSLSAGTYTVMAVDALGCTVTATFTLTLPPLPNIVNVTVNPVPCFGGVGSIVVNTSIISPPAVSLTYTFLPPTPGMTATSSGAGGIVGTYNNVPAGTYDLIVTNSNGCKDTAFGVVMTQPATPVSFGSVVVDSVLCFGTATGTITAQAIGGTISANSYQYAIKFGASPFTVYSAPTLAPYVFTNLAAGTYTIRTRDHNLCLKDSVVTIYQPTKLNLLIDDIDSTCFGTSNGEICIIDTGGTADYQYKLGVAGAYSAPQPAASPFCYSGLAAGTYTLFTIDAKGCLDTVTATVSPIALPNVSFTAVPNDTVCIGSSVTLSGTGATLYTWAGVPAITNANAFIPLAGTTQYTVTGTDASTSCSNTAIAYVRADTLPIVAPVSNQIVCNNNLTTAINFISSAGTTFTWAHDGTGIGLASPGAGNVPSFTAVNTTSLPIVVTFTVTPTGAPITNCVGNDITFTITITPDAFISLTSPVGTDSQTVCINTPIDPIIYQATGGGTGFTYAGLPTGVSGTPLTGTITGVPTVTGVYTYTVTTTGSCAQTSTVGTIDVTPNASIALTSPVGTNTQTVCINSGLANIDYTIGGTGTGGLVTGLPAGVNFSVSGNIITITGSPSIAGLFTYTVTATGTCASVTITGTINVTPLQDPSFSYLTGGTYCQTGTDPIATITGVPGGTFSAVPNTLVINSTTGLIDLSASPINVYTVQYVTPGPCPDSSTVAINITLAPCATFNYAVSSYCQNGVNPLPVFTGLCGGGAFTASSALLVIDPSTGEIDLANSTAGTYTVTNSIVAAGGCAAATDTTVVTIDPNANIALSSAVGTDTQSVCVNTPIINITYAIGGGGTAASAAGLPTGVVGNYAAGVFTISGSPSVVGTTTYTVTTTGTCGQTSTTGTITATPNATIALSSAAGTDGQTVCVNTSIVDITYAIGGGGSGASYAGLPPGVLGSFSGGTATLSGTPSLVGVYTYTVTTTGTCVQTNITGTITVDTNAILTLTSPIGTNTQTVCINSGITNINYTIGGTGTAGFVTGLPAGVTFAAGNPIVISGTPSVAGLYTYTVTATGTCASTTTTGTINIVPLQDPSFSYSPATYCITGTDPLPILTGTTGGTFSATPGGLSINASTGLIDLSLCTPSATPYVVKYVTPGPCPDSTTFNINIVTSPLAGPFAYGATNYCQSALDPLPIFTAPAVSGAFSATPPGLTIDISSGLIDVSNSTPGTYTVKNLIVAAGGCAADSSTTIVTIEATTVLVDPTDQQLCNGAQTTIVNLVSSLAGTTYTYTCNGTIGLAATGTIPGGVLNPFTVTNTGNTPIIDTIIITPIGANGCPGIPHSFTIQVDPTPVITDPANQIICAGDPTNAVNFVSTVANSIFNWSISNPAIGIAGPPPVGSVPSFIGINAGSTNVTGIVTITATGPAPTFCAATSQSYTYTVQPSATLTLTSGSNTQTVCKGSPIANINYTIGGTGNNATVTGLPPGMTFTSTSSSVTISGSSNAAVSVPTAYVYTVTATGTCGAGSATGTITIDTLLNPTFTFASPTICNTGTAGPNLVVNPGGVFSVTPALGAGSFNTATGTFILPVATGGYIVKYVTPGPCKDSTILAVTVTNAPCAQFSYAAISYCQSGTNPSPVFQAGCSAGGFSFIPAIAGNVLAINASSGLINLATSNAGTYQVINTILPSGTCPGVADTFTITIVSKPNPVAGLINPAGCNPTCNGSVQITTTGGSPFPGPSYNYAIAGTGTPAISAAGLATSMCSGSVYTITATDAIGCTGTVTVTMTISPAVNITAIGSSVTAPGACNGTITATGIGGTPGIGGYVYSISPALVQAPIGQFNNACDTSLAGSNAPCYTVTVTDSKGCTATTVVCIGTLDCIITSQVNVSCNGGVNGSFTDSVSGGVGPYTFSIAPVSAGITQTSAVTSSSSNLAAGNYTVTVTDANLIAVTRVITITQPAALAFATPVIGRPSCFPGCDGTLIAIANGGTNPKTYVIAGPPGSPCTPTQSTPGSFAGLGVGNYTITVTDSNLCVHDTVINIQLSPAPTLSLTKVNPTCNGLCNGTITAVAGAGTPPFSFAITSPAGSLCVPTQPSSGNFATLGGGTYTIVVTDSKGCNKSDTITLVNPPLLTLNAPVITNPLCNGNCNGTVTLSGTGGTSGPGSPTFTLTSGIPQSNTSGIFNSLCAATYTASITDASGCSVSTTLTLSNPTSLSWTTNTPTNITCNGANDGIINVVASGGVGVKVYSKDGINFAISGNFTSLAAGTYTITAKDVNGCTLTTVHTIVEPPAITLSAPTIQNVKCNGTNTGSISITAGGGTPGYLYDIVPVVAAPNSTGTFINLPAGVYAITVTDTTGCTKTLSGIIVTEPAVLSYTLVNHQNVACYGDATGTITASTQGGTPAVTFSILPNFGAQGPAGFFSGLIAGTYIVTATDVNNCSVSTSVTITEGPRIFVSNTTIQEPICHGDANGSISFTASGGTGTLNFQLNGGPAQSDTVFNNLVAGNYILTVIDALGCSTNINIQVTEPDAVGAILNLQGANCVDSKDGKAIVIGTGGRGGYVYYITPGLHINKSGVFYALGPGAYVLRVVDTAGCEYSVPFSINPPAFPLSNIITKQDLACNGFGNEGSATANASGGTPPYTYEWSTTPVQTTAKASTLYFGYYDVKVVDANGCVIKDTVYIEEGPCCDVAFIPNAFSPNGDFNNDVFRVLTTAGVELIQLEVYNRWGKRVWSTIDYRSGWDGTFENSPAPTDTYHYIYRYKCTRDGKTYTKKGDVILIR